MSRLGRTAAVRRAIVEHPRIGRWEGTDKMIVRFTPDPSAQTRSLFLSNSFAEVFQVEGIQPLPARTVIEASGQRLFFDNPGHDSGMVTLHLRAQSAGPASFSVGIDGELFSLSSFIFP